MDHVPQNGRPPGPPLKSPPSKGGVRLPWAIWLVGVAAAVIVLSKGITLVFPPPTVPIITPVSGTQLLTTETAPALIGRSLPVPTFTAGAALHAAARFTETNASFPTGTIELVFAKDGRRLFEVLELPITGVEDVAKYAPGVGGMDVKVGDVIGHVFDPGISFPACLKANEDRPLAVCQFTKRFAFTRGNVTYVVAVDGEGLSEGELIQIARSIP